jgi:quercetin dioxygenase-like cupin family protein
MTHAEPATLRDRTDRRQRLDQDWLHLFSIEKFVAALRDESEYARNGSNGLLLHKTESLSVVLEVAAAEREIGRHVVPGPTVVQVLEGSLRFRAGGETRIAHAGEMVVIPHDRPREIHAESDSAFLWLVAQPDPRQPAEAETQG